MCRAFRQNIEIAFDPPSRTPNEQPVNMWTANQFFAIFRIDRPTIKARYPLSQNVMGHRANFGLPGIGIIGCRWNAMLSYRPNRLLGQQDWCVVFRFGQQAPGNPTPLG